MGLKNVWIDPGIALQLIQRHEIGKAVSDFALAHHQTAKLCEYTAESVDSSLSVLCVLIKRWYGASWQISPDNYGHVWQKPHLTDCDISRPRKTAGSVANS